MASRGEAGIEGMPAEKAAVVREAEQRRAAAIVGVHDIQFWNEPDGNIRNTASCSEQYPHAMTSKTIASPSS